jgi:hypothetical protein
MSIEVISVVAAKTVLDISALDEIIQTADRLLEQGIYTYSLGELATGGNPHGKGPERLLTDAAHELGFATPSRQEALMTLARYYLGRIAEGVESPFDGILRMWGEFYHPLEFTNDVKDINRRCLGEKVRDWFHRDEYRTDLLSAGYLSREQVDEEFRGEERAILATTRQWIQDQYWDRLEPAWLSWNEGTVLKLAQSIATDGVVDQLPILADALEDAGCGDADILAHCRGGGEHVRGCWVVDLLLGKE